MPSDNITFESRAVAFKVNVAWLFLTVVLFAIVIRWPEWSGAFVTHWARVAHDAIIHFVLRNYS